MLRALAVSGVSARAIDGRSDAGGGKRAHGTTLTFGERIRNSRRPGRAGSGPRSDVRRGAPLLGAELRRGLGTTVVVFAGRGGGVGLSAFLFLLVSYSPLARSGLASAKTA